MRFGFRLIFAAALLLLLIAATCQRQAIAEGVPEAIRGAAAPQFELSART